MNIQEAIRALARALSSEVKMSTPKLEKLLTLIMQSDYTARQLAQEVKVRPQLIYRVMDRLKKMNLVAEGVAFSSRGNIVKTFRLRVDVLMSRYAEIATASS